MAEGYFASLNPYLIPGQEPLNPMDPEFMRKFAMEQGQLPPEAVAPVASPVPGIPLGDPKALQKMMANSGASSGSISVTGLGEEARQIQEKLNAKVEAATRSQIAGADKMQADYDKLASKPRDIDFSALAAYFDSTVEGSKIGQGYKAPESEEEKAQKMLGLQGAIQKARDGISDKEIDSMKAQLSNNTVKQQLTAMQGMGRAERFNESQTLKKEDTLRKDVAGIGDKVAEANALMGGIEENLASGDYQKVANTLSNFSRAVGGEKGVLTDQDIARVLPKNFQGSIARFTSYFGATPSAQIPPEYTKALVELTQTAKRRAAEKFGKEIALRKKGYGAPTSAYRDIMPGVGTALFNELESNVQGMNPAPQAGAAAVDPAKRLAELRAKAGR